MLGCLNNRRDFAKTNTNSTFTGTLGSEEFLRINGLPPGFGLNSLYDAGGYRNFTEPRDVRVVNTPFTPEYEADELQVQGRIEHDFGGVTAQLTGIYQSTSVDSRQDYNLGVADRSFFAPALNQLAFFAANVSPAYFGPIAQAIIPQGPNGPLCTSDASLDNRGAYEGNSICSDSSLQFDRSNGEGDAWSVEGIVSSDFDGSAVFDCAS